MTDPSYLDIPREWAAVFARDGRIFYDLDELLKQCSETAVEHVAMARGTEDSRSLGRLEGEAFVVDFVRRSLEALRLEANYMANAEDRDTHPDDSALAVAQRNIEEHGVHLMWIHGTESEPPFAYTVGLTRLGHPELITFGMSGQDSAWVLNNLAFRVRDGVQRFDTPQCIFEFSNGFSAQLIAVEDSSEHLTLANRMFRPAEDSPISALQVVFPDSQHRWPWEPESSFSHHPLLGAAPSAMAPTALLDLLPHDPSG